MGDEEGEKGTKLCSKGKKEEKQKQGGREAREA
jgi:hypothetical protein